MRYSSKKNTKTDTAGNENTLQQEEVQQEKEKHEEE